MRPLEGIVTDASHSAKYQQTKFRGIDIRTGSEIFFHEIGYQTVNIGEFLGLVYGLKYIIETHYSPKVLYTDSMTAISWLNDMKASSQKKNVHVAKSEIFLRLFFSEINKIKVAHWNNSAWGENPADFGNK